MKTTTFQTALTTFTSTFTSLVEEHKICFLTELRKNKNLYDSYFTAAYNLSRALVYSPVNYNKAAIAAKSSLLEHPDFVSIVALRFVSKYDTIVHAYTQKFPQQSLPVQLQLERYIKSFAPNCIINTLSKPNIATASIDTLLTSEGNKTLLDTISDTAPSAHQKIESAENILRYMRTLTAPKQLFSFVVIYGMENTVSQTADRIYTSGASFVFYTGLADFAQVAELNSKELAPFMSFTDASFNFSKDVITIREQLSHSNNKMKNKLAKICNN